MAVRGILIGWVGVIYTVVAGKLMGIIVLEVMVYVSVVVFVYTIDCARDDVVR